MQQIAFVPLSVQIVMDVAVKFASASFIFMIRKHCSKHFINLWLKGLSQYWVKISDC